MPAVLEAATKDHADNPTLAHAIREYWIRLSLALRVENGRFEKPQPEWAVLEQVRDAIETSIRSVCLFATEEGKVEVPGMGFLIGERTILTHQSMMRLASGEQEPARRAMLAFADHHDDWPSAFDISTGFLPIDIEWVEKDEPTGACAFRFATDPNGAPGFPPPLRLLSSPPSDLVGRKVYVLGYPKLHDSYPDPSLAKRIMGNVFKVLRVQPGEIRRLGPNEEILHNCFTLMGDGGSPLIDLQTGAVLGLHYAANNEPGPDGLKFGRAIPISRLRDRPVLTRTAAVHPSQAQPDVERIVGIEQAASRVCGIEDGSVRIGSGFLISPDLVLTCFHVVSESIKAGRLSGLRCRFDHPFEETANEAIPLVHAEVIASSRMAERYAAEIPGDLDLDYALLRLEVSPGGQRGWFGLSPEAVVLPPAESPILVMTSGASPPLMRGVVRGYDRAGTRLTYSLPVHPLAGSGAPCLDSDLNVVAMHQSSASNDPSWRGVLGQGVALTAILPDLSAQMTLSRRRENQQTSSFVESAALAGEPLPENVRTVGSPGVTSFAQTAQEPEAQIGGPLVVTDTTRAAVDGGSIVSFVAGLNNEEKSDVLCSMLFAQREASEKYDRFALTKEWYNHYSEVLVGLGWRVENFAFAEHGPSKDRFSMEKSALDAIASIATGSQLAALAKAIDTLRKVDEDDHASRLFNLHAANENNGNFQIGAAQKMENGAISVAVGAFHFKSEDHRARFLFWSWGGREISFWIAVSKMILHRDRYAEHRKAVIAALKADASDYVAELEII